MILEGLEVEEDMGNLVKVKRGVIDFTCLGNCYVRTIKAILYEVMDKIAEGEGEITSLELSCIIKEMLDRVEGSK